MADVKWIKIVTDIFDDEKMLLIDGLPERDGIIVIWFKLLCMAGKQNNGGVFMLNDRIAYTDEMLSTIFRRPLNTVRLALKTFEEFGMIEIVNNTITLPNWQKHQTLDKYEKAQEANRKRVAAYRERQKLLANSNNKNSEEASNTQQNEQSNDYCNVTVMESNAIEEDKEEDKEKDKEKDNKTTSETMSDKNKKSIDYLAIVNAYKETCVSLPSVRALSENRKKAIRARLNSGYTQEDFITLFQKTQQSDFLKGKNERNWNADFDWLIKDANMAKVLEGKYDNKPNSSPAKPENSNDDGVTDWLHQFDL